MDNRKSLGISKLLHRLARFIVGVAITAVICFISINLAPGDPVKSAIDLDIYPVPFELGLSASYIRDEGMYYAHCVYPDTELPNIDSTIEAIVKDFEAAAYDEYLSSRQEGHTGKASFAMQCKTYSIANGFGVVLIDGTYTDSISESPKDYFRSLHVDLNNDRIIALPELYDLTREKSLLEIIERQALNYYPHIEISLNRRDFDSIAILTDGLSLAIERGKYLPASEGPISITVPYQVIGDLIIASPLTVEKRDYSYIDPNKKVIALTFDDGPSDHTLRLVDVLRRHNAKGSFFVLGSQIKNYHETLRKVDEAGYQVLGHSWSHRNLTQLSKDEIRQDSLLTSMAIYRATGRVPRYIRPPYGSYNDTVREACHDIGISLVNWNVDTEDWKSRNVDSIVAEVARSARDGCIVLFHDIYPTTVEAIEIIVPELVRQGYQLLTVDELLHHKHGEVVPGKLYFN
ncbi:MAG: polysaccharide deacetylase family protein [Eubacteriaceae bacterium]|nr:polysaccharide deacetylase family protein [Eubacteriaceae bacterium]